MDLKNKTLIQNYNDILRVIVKNAVSKLNKSISLDRVRNEFISEVKLGNLYFDNKENLQLYTKFDENEIIEFKDNMKKNFIKETEILDVEIKKKLSLSIKPNQLRPNPRHRSYDQVVKGNVKIVEVKNNNEYSHKITFNKIGKFLQYQVFDPKGTVQFTHLPRDPSNHDHPTEFNQAKTYIKENPDKVTIVNYQINEDRNVVLKTGKEWVLYFNNIPGFTPTTVMEIGYKKYVCIIKKAKINKKDKVVFYISTKEILVNNKSIKMKKLKQIPTGKYKNVRFDIDYGQSITNVSCNDSASEGTNTCYCPSGSYITTLDVSWIGTCEWDSCTAAERGGWDDLADVCWYTYNGYCDWCSYEDCYCVWGACWRHTDNWPHAAYSVGIYKYVIESYPLSQLWDDVPGYFCNSEGIMGGSVGGALYTDCKPGVGACIRSSDNSKNCCFPDGSNTCCPPGSGC